MTFVAWYGLLVALCWVLICAWVAAIAVRLWWERRQYRKG